MTWESGLQVGVMRGPAPTAGPPQTGPEELAARV